VNGYILRQMMGTSRLEAIKHLDKLTEGQKVEVNIFKVSDLKWVPFYSDQRQLVMKILLKNESNPKTWDFQVIIEEIK